MSSRNSRSNPTEFGFKTLNHFLSNRGAVRGFDLSLATPWIEQILWTMPYVFAVILVTTPRDHFQQTDAARASEKGAPGAVPWISAGTDSSAWNPCRCPSHRGAIPDRIPTAKRVLISTAFRIPMQTVP